LQHLNTWHDWQRLFDYAHLCAAARPGFTLAAAHIPPEVATEFGKRQAVPGQIRNKPAGLTCLANDLDIDVSATAIRDALQHGEQPAGLPARVLHYITTHQLYKN